MKARAARKEGQNPPATLGDSPTGLGAADRVISDYEQVLQERRVPDPDRGRAGVLRAEADRELEPSAALHVRQPAHAARRAIRSRASTSRRRTTPPTSSCSTAHEVLGRLSRTPTRRSSITLAHSDPSLDQSQFDIQGKASNGWLSLLTYILPFVIFIGLLDLPDEPGPGRRLEGDVVRQVARQADVGRLAQDHVQGRRGGRRSR